MDSVKLIMSDGWSDSGNNNNFPLLSLKLFNTVDLQVKLLQVFKCFLQFRNLLPIRCFTPISSSIIFPSNVSFLIISITLLTSIRLNNKDYYLPSHILGCLWKEQKTLYLEGGLSNSWGKKFHLYKQSTPPYKTTLKTNIESPVYIDSFSPIS